MENVSNNALQQFRNLVGIRFQLYNSLFTSLPFHRIEKTGVLRELRSRSAFEKPSVKRRQEIIRAVYKQKTYGNQDN